MGRQDRSTVAVTLPGTNFPIAYSLEQPRGGRNFIAFDHPEALPAAARLHSYKLNQLFAEYWQRFQGLKAVGGNEEEYKDAIGDDTSQSPTSRPSSTVDSSISLILPGIAKIDHICIFDIEKTQQQSALPASRATSQSITVTVHPQATLKVSDPNPVKKKTYTQEEPDKLAIKLFLAKLLHDIASFPSLRSTPEYLRAVVDNPALLTLKKPEDKVERQLWRQFWVNVIYFLEQKQAQSPVTAPSSNPEKAGPVPTPKSSLVKANLVKANLVKAKTVLRNKGRRQGYDWETLRKNHCDSADGQAFQAYLEALYTPIADYLQKHKPTAITNTVLQECLGIPAPAIQPAPSTEPQTFKQAFTTRLANLQTEADNISDDPYAKAAADNLIAVLSTQIGALKEKATQDEVTNFKTACTTEIDQAMPKLQAHQGFRWLLYKLVSLLLTPLCCCGVCPATMAGGLFARTGKTDASGALSNLKDTVTNLQLERGQEAAVLHQP